MSTERNNQSGAELDSRLPLEGLPPTEKPPRVVDYEELDKKSIDNLVDALKYVATTSGVGIAMYSQALREYVKLGPIENRPIAKALLFAPLCFWFLAIICTVVGIFPRRHQAKTDFEKEQAVIRVRDQKARWARFVLVPFLCGFAILLYVIAAQIWNLFPFK
ncbi:MAG TPA: hypothetical protein VFZ22_17380 [Pyrinomonadaceae bacterium]|nr:hypothetical protein [Pyrinomonadaceae bacterium]